MTVVLDVSAAIEIVLKKDKKELFDKTFRAATWVIAPELFISEFSNVLWKYHKAKVLSHEECAQYVEDGIDLIDDFVGPNELWREALSEGLKNNHSVYDMFYLVLTRRNDATLITNDGPLAEVCRKVNVGFVF